MNGFKLIARVFTIAYDIFSGLILGVVVGYLFDQWLGTKAIFTIVLSLWGIYHGFKMMMKLGE